MTRTDALLVHVPKTGGTSIAEAFGLKDTHTPALERWCEDPDAWDSAFTFAIIRNPWDHAVSLWFHTGKWKEIEFIPWVRGGCKCNPIRHRDVSDQWGYICDEERKPLVKTVYDFANLGAVYADLASTVCMPFKPMPHVHEKLYEIEGGRMVYTDYFALDGPAINAVWARNREVIRAFDYTYGDGPAHRVRRDL